MSSSGRHSDRRRVEGQLSGACQSLRYALAKERSGLRSGVLKSYARYYNETRTHRSLDKDAPISRPVQRAGSITSHALLGGLHHHYIRVCVFGTHRWCHFSCQAGNTPSQCDRFDLTVAQKQRTPRRPMCRIDLDSRGADRARGRNIGEIEMKKLFLAGAALMVFGGSAIAADISRRPAYAPPPAPPPPVYS